MPFVSEHLFRADDPANDGDNAGDDEAGEEEKNDLQNCILKSRRLKPRGESAGIVLQTDRNDVEAVLTRGTILKRSRIRRVRVTRIGPAKRRMARLAAMMMIREVTMKASKLGSESQQSTNQFPDRCTPYGQWMRNGVEMTFQDK